MDESGTDHLVARSLDSSSNAMMDEGDLGRDMNKKPNSQIVENKFENGSLSDDLGSQLSSCLGEFGKEKEALDANTVSRTTKVAGLHELVMLAEECESEETAKSKGNDNTNELVLSFVQGNDNTKKEAHIDHNKHPSAVVDDWERQSKQEDEQKNGGGSTTIGVIPNRHSREVKHDKSSSSVSEKGRNGSFQMQKSRVPHLSTSVKGVSKIVAKGNTQSSLKGNMGEKSQVAVVKDTMSPSAGSVDQPVKLGTTTTKCTVPQPFALATDKRASTGVQPANAVDTKASRRTAARSAPLSSVAKKDQFSAKPATQPLSNPPHYENMQTVKTTSEAKGKPGTVAAKPGFSFRCNKRAEKRKEFFSKLEEKVSAMEAEKSHLQAKSKEQQEAEIKMLRKSMIFKASPLPTFYHEGPPAKVELKKIPPTRAKSPKLGRRKSYAGAESEKDPSHVGKTSRFSLDEKKSNGNLQTHIEENIKKAKSRYKDGKKTTGFSLNKTPSEKSFTSNSNEVPLSLTKEISNSPEEGPVNGSAKELSTSTVSANSSGSTSGSNIVAPEKFEAIEKHNEIESLGENSEFVRTTSDRESVTVHTLETVEEQKESESLDGENMISETDVWADIFKESCSPVNIVEDVNSGAAFGTGNIAEDLQVLDGPKSNANRHESHFRSNGQNEQIQEIDMDNKGTKLKSVRCCQQGSAGETNGKDVRNLRREQLKATTPLKNSKRENGKPSSLKKIGKGNNGMTPTSADVSVHS